MIRFYRRLQDIEQGMPVNEHDVHQQRRATRYNRWILVVVALLFFLNYPLVFLFIILSFLLCISSCLRFIIHYNRDILGNVATADFWTRLNPFRISSEINLANLRLTMLNRDFNENGIHPYINPRPGLLVDYDMLLALDNHMPPVPAERQLTHEELNALLLRVYQSVEDKEEICTVCLEVFKSGDRLRLLPCRHVFHESCIGAWLRQKGRLTTCPICKKRIISSDR